MLAYYGAEVIKVEPPNGGDPLRGWRGLDKDGVSPWFRSLGRNKKSVAVDLRKPEGRKIAKDLALTADVLIENFKPGTLEKWGMGPEELLKSNPSLVFCRVSGYGQTGPYASKAGYASVCEAMGGFRYVTGFPGQAPVRPNISMGDTVAGLHAVVGVLLGLLSRNKLPNGLGSGGQVVDVSLYESVLNLMEGVIPVGTMSRGLFPFISTNLRCVISRNMTVSARSENRRARRLPASFPPTLTSAKTANTSLSAVGFKFGYRR